MDIISVVLGADTKKDRTRDSIEIIEYCFAQNQMLDMNTMLNKKFDDLVRDTKFDVIKGVSNEVKLKLVSDDISLYPVNKQKEKDIVCEAKINNILIAPVSKEEIVRKNYY